MNLRFLVVAAAVSTSLTGWCQQRAERHSVLMKAKNLMVTTTRNQVYYYLVSNDHNPVIHLQDGNIRILNDEFSIANIASMRFHALPHFILDEDSVTYDKNKSVDHGLMALRRSLTVGQWNSLVLPVNLTTEQVLDAFGEGTELAEPRGIRENDVTVVELQSVELTPGETVIKSGFHYLIRPTREADIAADSWTSSFISGQKLVGPIYMIPNVSTPTSTTAKTPRTQSFASTDESVKIYFRGTYLKLDDSVLNGTRITNSRIDAGTYMLSNEGKMVKNGEAAEVKAFTLWVQDISNQKQEQLRFYIDGVNEDISEFADALPTVRMEADADEAIYDLGGRRVGTAKDRHLLKAGIYVIRGQKVAIK